MSPVQSPGFGRLTRSIKTACAAMIMTAVASHSPAAAEDLGNGFRDHGVAVPISNHRGIVATVDGKGDNVVLAWLFDYRGGYSLLMVNAKTGSYEQFMIPFQNPKKDSPFASILSSGNKYYSHFGDHFIEFDPTKPGFTFHAKTAPQMAMGMTEDDNGVIWSVTYPDSAVAAFDPKTREFRDFGPVYNQNWAQYQRDVAADDAGWIYFGIGHTASQIVALDPSTSTAKPLLPEEERKKGTAHVYRDMNGKVYGQAYKGEEPWYEFYQGEIKKIGKLDTIQPKPYISGSQALYHKQFPNGDVLEELDLVERKLTVQTAGTSETKAVSFDYTSEGAIIMGIAAAPGGIITGGTAFPMRNFVYNPAADSLMDRAAYGQWNTITALKDKVFVGGYPQGYLLEWDPAQPWVATDREKPESNPKFLTGVSPAIHRPHSLLALPDESLVIMGGTPQYGYTGGGLLFWDRKNTTQTLLTETDMVPDQSTSALIDLPGGKLLGGTTTNPGTGGEKKANQAELYLMDIASKKIEKKPTTIPGVQTYTDFEHGSNGIVYGFADRKIFFVYDVEKAEIVYQEDISGTLGLTVAEQGPRVFVKTADKLYVLLEKGVAELDQSNHKISMIAESPVRIKCGGDYHDGRLYFGTDSHLLSYQLDQITTGAATAD